MQPHIQHSKVRSILTNWPQQPPAVEVKLQQSSFGLGLMHDRLVLSAESRYAQFEVSPTIVLALVEGILGYERIYSDGGQWTYRRDTAFKNL